LHRAIVAHSVDPDNEAFRLAQQAAVQRVRDIISGLRPATLQNFGLYPAMDELFDELETRARQSGQPGLQISLEVAPSEQRYPAEAELAVYRIVQQAGQNAIKHARAHTLTIRGQLEPGRMALCVEDDGQGFQTFARSELTSLLVHQHFGLLNMYERAEAAGACLEFDSAPGQGTRVRLRWPALPQP
jgi:signal transduction histidine kinase